MPSDAWADLNRRAAAVQGGVPWQIDMEDRGDVCTHVDRDGTPWLCSGIRAPYHAPDAAPDLRSAATRGILRAALGSPCVKYRRHNDEEWFCFIRADKGTYLTIGRGATREQAEAAALVALAEARGQWGPG